MKEFSWITFNWPELVSSAGVVLGLLLTGFSLRAEARARRVGNLIAITTNHRQIWGSFIRNPALKRVLDPALDPAHIVVTAEEELFVTFLILHLYCAFRATGDGLLLTQDGLRADVRSVFQLPLPNAIWNRLRPLQQEDFARFVDSCLG